MRPFRLLVAVASALGLFAAGTPPQPLTSPVAAREAIPLRLAAATTPAPPADPCFDYDALEAGRGDPVRQDAFNHLDARGYARWRMACVYQWGTAEWDCLDGLWREESSWRHDIYGRIPQAMPETKIAAAGADWRTNPRVQVRWGLAYIDDRYGKPTSASLHSPPTPCHAGY